MTFSKVIDILLLILFPFSLIENVLSIDPQLVMQTLGLPFDSSLIHEVPPSLSGSYESTKALLRQGVTFPSAMLAINDCIALGAIKAFKEAGVKVPEDISVDDRRRLNYSE